MKKILILGGSGFIGRNLVEYFSSRQYEVFAPGHNELDLLDKDAVDAFFRRSRFDLVIYSVYLGNYRIDDPSKGLLKKNLKMFFNVAENKDRYDRMFFLGSGAEYDRSIDIIDVNESEFGKHIPQDDYGFCKYVCSRYIVGQSDNIIDLRLFGVFGKYEDYKSRFVSSVLHQHMTGQKRIEMVQNMFLDYIYVKDLCRIIERLSDSSLIHRAYNVGSNKHVDLVSLGTQVLSIVGSDAPLYVKDPGLKKRYTCDSSRLLSELGDFRFTPLKEAILELNEYYLKNMPDIDAVL